MAKFQLDTKGTPSANPKVSQPTGFELDTQGSPKSFPGHGSGGSHVSGYGSEGAFVMAIPPVGFDKPVEAPALVDSTKEIVLRNGLGKSNDEMPYKVFGQTHRSQGNNDFIDPPPGKGGRVVQNKVEHSAEHKVFSGFGE